MRTRMARRWGMERRKGLRGEDCGIGGGGSRLRAATIAMEKRREGVDPVERALSPRPTLLLLPLLLHASAHAVTPGRWGDGDARGTQMARNTAATAAMLAVALVAVLLVRRCNTTADADPTALLTRARSGRHTHSRARRRCSSTADASAWAKPRTFPSGAAARASSRRCVCPRSGRAAHRRAQRTSLCKRPASVRRLRARNRGRRVLSLTGRGSGLTHPAGGGAKEDFFIGLYIALIGLLVLVYPIHKKIESFWEVRRRPERGRGRGRPSPERGRDRPNAERGRDRPNTERGRDRPSL